MDSKTEIRIKVRRLFLENRRQLPLLSRAIINKLEIDPDFISASTVALYWSLHDEVETHQLINKWFRQKTILLPSIEDEYIVLKEFTGQQQLKPGMKYHIPEPTSHIFEDLNKVDLIVTPGMAFDKENNRMGRGKGFYDRLMPNLDCTKIGLCYKFQVFDKIPSEPHDIKVDKLVY